MSDTPPAAASAGLAEVAAAQAPAVVAKRRPSAILAELETRVDELHAVKATYAAGIDAIRALKLEYAAAEGDIAAVFHEVETLPERVAGWFEALI